ALQVRRELLDLARYHSVRGAGARLPEPHTEDFGAVASPAPDDLELWARFHEAAEALPVEEREAFGLLFYHGYTREQAALLLALSERTVSRWWASACLALNQPLGGLLPPE